MHRQLGGLLAVIITASSLGFFTPAAGDDHRKKTNWGYVQAKDKKAPKQGKCRKIPVTIDVRNARNLPETQNIGLIVIDEFSNFVGFNYLNTVDIENGKYRRAVSVCAKPHTFSPGFESFGEPVVYDLDPYLPGESYRLVACDFAPFSTEKHRNCKLVPFQFRK